MYLNKKELNDLLHRMFIITWCESRTVADKRLTNKEMQDIEKNVISFVLNTTKGAKQ